MKILNLYAGLGGNRKLWKGHDVTAVEWSKQIAYQYSCLYPQDTTLVDNAHDYLVEHADEFDFIWSSPPCQSHSRMVKATRHNVHPYPDLSLYEEILFLQNKFKGGWVVENVVPYYTPLVKPTRQVGRHLFWSNFEFEADDVKRPKNFINNTNTAGANALKEWLGIHYEGNIYYEGNHCPAQVLRNCVHPLVGKQILEAYSDLHQ